jgi:hypothetical protein
LRLNDDESPCDFLTNPIDFCNDLLT